MSHLGIQTPDIYFQLINNFFRKQRSLLKFFDFLIFPQNYLTLLVAFLLEECDCIFQTYYLLILEVLTKNLLPQSLELFSMRVPLRQFNFYKIPFLIVVTLELHNLICVRYVLSFH
jgi:hypothetical protein